jgi:hypothetical protein
MPASGRRHAALPRCDFFTGAIMATALRFLACLRLLCGLQILPLPVRLQV